MDVPEPLKRVASVAVDSVVGLIALSALGGIGSVFAILWAMGPASAVAVPVAIVGGVMMVAAFAVTYRTVVEYHDRSVRKRRMDLPPQELERLLCTWLYRNKFNFQDDRKPTDDFRIVTDNDLKVPVTIIKPKAGRWLLLVARIEVSAQHRALVDSQPRIRHDIAMALNYLGVQFHLDLTGERLDAVDLSHLVLFDETMGELMFFREIYLLRRATFVVTSLVQRDAPPASPPLLAASVG